MNGYLNFDYLLLLIIANYLALASSKCPAVEEDPVPKDCSAVTLPLDAYSNCYEIGCTVGSSCRTEGSISHKCCSYIVNSIVVSCCLKRSPKRPCGVPPVVTDTPQYRPQPLNPDNKCTGVVLRDPHEHCIEIGCVLGTACRGDFSKLCCPHVTKIGVMVTCCRDDNPPVTTTPAPDLPTPRWVPHGYECVEVGCTEGEPCKTPGLENQTCTHYYESLYPQSCCLKPLPESTLAEKEESATPRWLPYGYKCLEIGCIEGEPCKTPGLQNQRCTHYYEDLYPQSCCLQAIVGVTTAKNEDATPLWVPHGYKCVETGCTEGEHCRTPGLEVQRCTHYYENFLSQSCCLQAIEKPTTPKQEEHATPRWIPDGYECVELGCTAREHCRTPELHRQRCANYYNGIFSQTCCLRPIVELPTTKTEDFSCVPYEVPRFYNCLEMGCKVGSYCHSKGVENTICCPHKYGNVPVTCCLQRADPDNFLSSTPPYTTLSDSSMYHCFEMGCKIGRACKTKGMEKQKCCKHLINDQLINCCLSDDTSQHNLHSLTTPSARCPPRKVPEDYHCLEIGCKEGSPCKSLGLKHQSCCPHEVNGRFITCCLAKPVDNSPNILNGLLESLIGPSVKGPPVCPKFHNSKFIFECNERDCDMGSKCTAPGFNDYICCPLKPPSREKVYCCATGTPMGTTPMKTTEMIPPVFYPTICMDVGCTDTGSCPSAKKDGQQCMSHTFSGETVSCCTEKSVSFVVDIPLCTSLQVSGNCYCMEIGCTLGQPCLTPGLQHQVCCPHLIGDMIVSCCLATYASPQNSLRAWQSPSANQYFYRLGYNEQ